MSEKPTRRIGPLAETLCELDLREVPRRVCAVPVPVRVVIRPSFVPLTLVIKDISTKGVCLLAQRSAAPLPPDAGLALYWSYGPPERWRTLRLDVIWQAERPDGGWVAGCTFAERLSDEDVEAFLQEREAAARQTQV